MIRIEALRTFVEVADHGNIKDAAEKLCRTQSALSMTLKQIEDRLGCPLFETDRKHSLTDMGRYLYDTSVILLRDYDRAMELVVARAEARSGRLRLASVPSVAAVLVPQILRDFIASRPDVEIELVDTDSADVRALVETGQADLGVASDGPRPDGLEFDPLFSDPFYLVCRADSPLAGHPGPLPWDALSTETVILNEAARGLPSAAFRNLAATARLSVRNVTSLVAMVQSGMGVTLLPALATVNLPAALCARPLADAACMRTVGLIWRSGRVNSPLVAAFRAHFAGAARRYLAESGRLTPARGAAETA